MYLIENLEHLTWAKVEEEVKRRDYPAVPFDFMIFDWLYKYDIAVDVWPGEELVYHSRVSVSNNRIAFEPSVYFIDVVVK